MVEELDGAVPLGVVSQAGRWYVDRLLRRLFPSVKWGTVVTFDDVERRKPYPDGLQLAAERMGLQDLSRVAYVGDRAGDVEAAYHAGMRPVLATWGRPSPAAGALIPDAVLTEPEEVLEYLRDPVPFLPLLEARMAGDRSALFRRRVVVLDHDTGPLRVQVLGRYFAREGVTLALHEAHDLSRWIGKKNEAGPFPIPAEWVEGVSSAIAEQARRAKIDLVTVIPAKPDRDPRMERLLAAVEKHLAGTGVTVSFDPELFGWSDDAVPIKRVGLEDRCTEVERTLQLRGRCAGRRVLVLDDVLTVGCTLRVARDLLVRRRAAHVSLMALARNISGAGLRVNPERQSCPECGRVLKLLPNRKDGSHFWGCSGWFLNPKKCSYKRNA